jgi:hypothetical protein
MRKLLSTLLLGVFAAVLALAALPQQPVQAGGFEWETDYKLALEKARAEDKPIFLEFR